jgi:hypothetical protein
VGLDLKNLAQALGGDVSRNQVLAPGPGHSPSDRSLAIKLSTATVDGFVVHSFANDDPIICKDHVRQKLGIAAFQPKHRSKGALSPVVALAREHTVAAVQALAEIATKGKNENARITAAVALLDRAYGRPAQSVEMDLKLSKNLEQMTLAELQELRERYAALALASPALVIEHTDAEQQVAEPVDASDEADDEET